MKVLDRVRVIHDEHPRYVGEIGTVGTVYEQRRDKRELDCRHPAPVRAKPDRARTEIRNLATCPRTKQHCLALFLRLETLCTQSSNGSFCQVNEAKCSVLPSFRFAIHLLMKSVITGHL